MLSSLQIENVAVIQKADVHFEKGLNVLTGETGAGKSILIDSINAILGNRTSKDLVRTGAAKAVIRAAFDDVPGAVLDSLEKAGYERSDALTLSREITAEGKSTCRINGMPATAAILRELCGGLININGQHDSVGLLNPAHHEGILDAYAQNGAAFQAYYTVYRELIKVKKELDAIITDETEKQRKIDLLSYQVQEIEDAGLTAGEEQTLESRRKILANASAIRDKIAQSYALLSGDDEASGAVDLLGEASNAVDAAAQLDDALAGASSQLLDLYYNAKDVAADLIGRLDSYDTNDAELDEIEQAASMIQAAAHPDAHIIFGASISEDADDEIRVVVIATGFDNPPATKQQQDRSAMFSNAKRTAQTFAAPAQQFSAPAQQFSAPAQQFAAPAQSFSASPVAPMQPQQAQPSQAQASVADGQSLDEDDPFADIMKIFSSK